MAAPRPHRSPSHAALVAAGIFFSRIFGLIRQRVLGHYLGLGDGSDAFGAAFRIPNLLQNLLGEGVLSASFIPVYARLRAEGRDEDAERVAGAVFALLALVTSVVVLAGVLAAGPLTDLLVPGWTGAKRDLTVRLVRVLFPGAGLLVLSAWCLGVLNSHRRFLLPYAAPVLWNLAIIATLLLGGDPAADARTAFLAALGSVLGSALQFGIQLPVVLRLLRQFRLTPATSDPQVRTVIRNFGPVFFGRGVVQISAFMDTVIGSLLGTGAVAGLNAAQLLYTLPVSLFGMSVSAAELPAMSSATGSEAEIAGAVRARLEPGLRRIAFFVVPSAVAFLVFGRELAGALFQTGRFSAADSRYVWGILAGSAIGLLAATLGRLYSSALYALRDTRTPLRFAIVRVGLGILLGVGAALWLPGRLGIGAEWGAAGLTAASAIAATVECSLLRRAIRHRIGAADLDLTLLAGLWLAALLGAGAGFGCGLLLPPMHPALRAALVLLPFGLCYLALTYRAGVAESRDLVRRLRRR